MSATIKKVKNDNTYEITFTLTGRQMIALGNALGCYGETYAAGAEVGDMLEKAIYPAKTIEKFVEKG